MRGLGSSKKKAMEKDMVQRNKEDTAILQETKLGWANQLLLREVSPFHFVEGVCIPPSGASRSTWLFWDVVKIDVDCWVRQFSVSMIWKLRRGIKN